MRTFKVVLDGVELSDSHAAEIAQSVQHAVLDGLVAHRPDRGKVLGGNHELSVVAIFKGEILGGPILGGPIGPGLEKIVEQEFRG